MASTLQAYRETDGQKSPNNTGLSPFSLPALIEYSTLPDRHKRLLKAMLSKNRFGSELWLSTERLQVIIGRICFRRKTGQDTRGRVLSSCERIHRRTVQRTIDELAAPGVGVLEQVLEANVWVGHGKHRRFRRSATYALRPEKLHRQQTWEEYYAEKPRPQRSHESHRSSPSPAQDAAASPTSLPPATAAPVPAAAVQQQRETSRPPRRLTSREGPQLVAKVAELMRGYHGTVNTVSGLVHVDESHPKYRAPMSQEHALTAACMTLGIPYEAAMEHLKLCRWKFDEPESSA